jgi:4-hydroxy-tetrahydrodipicolinate synthase
MTTASTFDFTGVLTAITTPMSPDGTQIDETSVADLVDLQVNGGAGALVVCGSTGEHQYLTIDERLRTMDAFATASSGRIPLIMHVGTMRQSDAIVLTRRAKELGAEAIMAIPPYYDSPGKKDVYSYLEQVRNAAGLPFVYYHSPKVSGIQLDNADLAFMKQELGVDAVKDSRGDFGEYVRGLNDPSMPKMLGGADLHLLGAFCSGATGTVIGASAFIPERVSELYRAAVVNQDLTAARATWGTLYPILDFLMKNGYVPLTKAGCEMRGIRVGGLREPISDVSDDLKHQLQALLLAAGVPLAASAAAVGARS